MSGTFGPSTLDEPIYDLLVEDRMVFCSQRRDPPVDSFGDWRALCEVLLEEARLLDGDRLEEWLQLYGDDSVYWIPSTVDEPDPRRTVSLVFDDRRRMEDRVFRLRTGTAYSQIPPSRTLHHIGSFEAWWDPHRSGVARVRTSLAVHAYRHDLLSVHAGWQGHALEREDGGRWIIERRQIVLLNCDGNHDNLSFIL